MLEMALIGRAEAALTGSIAADAARLVLSGSVAGGVWHLEQVTALAQVLPALQSQGVRLGLEVVT